jgi:IclR family acetate operon transcriptional repressor
MPATTNSRAKQKESDKKPKSESKYFSRAVSKALEVLELLQADQAPLALNEVARRIRVSKTSTFRLLRTLETAGCVASTSRGQYYLAPGIHSVVPTQYVARLLRAATPRLQELSRDLHETASLAALFDNRVEVIAVNESSQTLRMSNVVGHIVPPNASSLGKAITAFQPDERREKLLRSFGIYRFTEHTITDRAALDREFAEVRLRKFALDREESVYDGNCFGVPIFGDAGEVMAAVSVSLPKARLRDAEHEKALLAALRNASAQIASDLTRV